MTSYRLEKCRCSKDTVWFILLVLLYCYYCNVLKIDLASLLPKVFARHDTAPKEKQPLFPEKYHPGKNPPENPLLRKKPCIDPICNNKFSQKNQILIPFTKINSCQIEKICRFLLGKISVNKVDLRLLFFDTLLFMNFCDVFRNQHKKRI